MKINLKKKVIFFSLIANLVTAVAIGSFLHRYAGEFYYQSFLESKESLARTIALAIDGDKHKTLTTLSSNRDPEYRKYLKFMNNIKLGEENITYLFTISYDMAKDKLMYIVDSDILVTDTIWITTEFFGLALTIGKKNEISIKYNENIYTGDFHIKIEGKSVPLKIGNDGVLSLGGRELARIDSKSPLSLESSGKKLNIGSRELYSKVIINNKPVDLYCSFTARGESESIPGELYAESKEVVERCKKIIASKKTTIVRRDTQTSIYGKNTSTVYGIITDSKGEANGLVVVELFDREISNFKRTMLIISLIVTIVIFSATIVFNAFLAEYLVIPISKLTKGARKVSEGDLDYVIKIKRSDEFGALAETFNNMVANLKKSYTKARIANEELNEFKNNLEKIVEERTDELRHLNGELSLALSEVKNLKGLLPICSSCKNIRDDNGYWNQIEHYISSHSQAEFTHSLCPTCAKRLYPGIYKEDS